MLSLILAAAVGQVYHKDLAFMCSQENWVMDQQPRDAGYMWYIPAWANERVEMWRSDSVECRRVAVRELVAEGSDAARPMFWTMRARDPEVVRLSEIVLGRLRLCGVCKGTGECPGFEAENADQDVSSSSCRWCNNLQYHHESKENVRECRTCDGRGYDMRIPGDYKP